MLVRPSKFFITEHGKQRLGLSYAFIYLCKCLVVGQFVVPFIFVLLRLDGGSLADTSSIKT